MKNLPDYTEFQNFPRTPLKSLFTAAGSDALDMLEKMLTYDPARRITAEEALRHYYFKNMPRPSPPEKLPKAPKEEKSSTKGMGPLDVRVAGGTGISIAGVKRKNDADGKR